MEPRTRVEPASAQEGVLSRNARDFLLWSHEPGLNQLQVEPVQDSLLWDRPCGTLETQDFPCQAPAGLVRQEAG